MKEELVTAIEEQQELNSGLAGAINSLNARLLMIMMWNQVKRYKQVKQVNDFRKLIEKIQESKLLSKVVKNSKKLQKKIEELK